MEKIRLELNLRGRVQGVFFRSFLQEKAQQFNIAGSAKNEQDGSLTVIIEGTKQKIDQFIPYLLQGPKYGEVYELTLKRAKSQNLEGFQIK